MVLKTIKKMISRLLITGIVGTNTPQCVIEEIKAAHNLDTDDLTILNQSKIILDSKDNKLRILARFINHTIEWDKDKLIQAYKFLIAFYAPEGSINFKDIIDQSSHIGLQTNDDPLSLNACILYRIACNCDLELSKKTTIEQMFTKILRFYEKHDVVTKSAMIEGYQSFHNLSFLKLKINPMTNIEAIIMAAAYYKIDITLSSQPIDDYFALRDSQGKQIITASLNYFWQRNQTIFDLNSTFNPFFPHHYYDIPSLKSMLLFSTHNPNGKDFPSIQNKEEVYEKLYLLYLLDNFHYGDHPMIKKRETYVNQTSLDEVDKHEIITYGTFQGNLIAVTIDELIAAFHSHQNLTNIFDVNALYSPDNIIKLKNILTLINTTKTRDFILYLDTLLYNNNDNDINILKNLYRKNPHNLKICLEQLFILMLYLRGWNGLDSYEHTIKVATSDEKFFDTISLNVTRAIKDFYDAVINLGFDEGATFLALPILIDKKQGQTLEGPRLVDLLDRNIAMEKSKVEGAFVKSKNKTIGDKIKDIKDGYSDKEDISSCIRTTSNYLGSTYYHYMIILGLSPKFDIAYLRKIA